MLTWQAQGRKFLMELEQGNILAAADVELVGDEGVADLAPGQAW